MTPEEIERITKVIVDPRSYKVPDWFLNRRKDIKDGKYAQLTASGLATRMRDDFERLKKIRCAGGQVLLSLSSHSIWCFGTVG